MFSCPARLLLLALFGGPLFVLCKSGQTILMVKFDDFEDCKNNSINEIRNAEISLVGRGFNVINADFVVSEPITTAKFVFTVSRCYPECEMYLYYGVDFCSMLTDEAMPWTRFLNMAQPKLRCPVQKGTYKFRNATLDAFEIMNMGTMVQNSWFENYDWKTKFEVKQNKTVLACGYTVYRFLRIKFKDNSVLDLPEYILKQISI